MAWTDEKVEILTQLWGKGHSASEIARIIGDVSRNAVIGKAHRLGLSGRPKTASSSSSPVVAKPKPVVRRRTPVEKPRPVFIAEGPIIGAGILDLTERMCRWPIGDPKSSDFKFCGRKVATGCTYCSEHASMAYQPPQSRRRDDEQRQQKRVAGSRF